MDRGSKRLDELMASARATDSEDAIEAEPYLETRTGNSSPTAIYEDQLFR